ncbi:MAG: cobalamin biosynthesis protein [Roseobacter sp.]
MIVAGFGFRQSARIDSLVDALQRASLMQTPENIATVSDKAETSVFRAFAQQLMLPIIEVSAENLSAQETVTMSQASLSARQTGSVAEAAALAGAGLGARLLAPRVISSDGLATCALAKGELQ